MSKSFMQKKNYTKLIQVLFSNKKVILLIGVIYTLIKSEKDALDQDSRTKIASMLTKLKELQNQNKRMSTRQLMRCPRK